MIKSLSEVSKKIKVSRQYIWNLIQRNTVKGIRLGRYWYLTDSQIERLKKILNRKRVNK